jgi:hypothetical protein
MTYSSRWRRSALVPRSQLPRKTRAPALSDIISFVLNYIPYIGPLIAVILPVIFSTAQFESWQMAAIIFGSLYLIQFIIGSYLEPVLTGNALAISPFVMLPRQHILARLLRQSRRGGGERHRRRPDRRRRARRDGDADGVDGNCLGPSGRPGRGGGRAHRQIQDLAR